MIGDFLQSVLPGFYRAAERSADWPLVLDQIKNELQVGSVVVQKFRLQGRRLCPEWVLRDSCSLANAEAHDSLVNNNDNPRLEIDVRDGDLADVAVIRADKNVDAYRQAEFKALDKRLEMLGLAPPIILGIRYDESSSLSMLLHPRSDARQVVDDRHGAFLQQLAPHLKQSVSLYEKLNTLKQENLTLSECLNRFNAGVIVVTECGQVRWLNRNAADLLQGNPHMSIVSNRLRCANTSDNAALAGLIAAAKDGGRYQHRAVATVGNGSDNPVQVLAVSVRMAHESCVALYLSRQNLRCELSAEEVVQLFGLTSAEARLAIALTDGKTLSEYADARRLSVGTVRIQLKSIFSKLGLTRQSELVRLIGSSITTRTLRLGA